MNYSTAIFLVNKDVRCVSVSYERQPDGTSQGPWVQFKTLDPDVAVGDLVVVPTLTRHEMTVVRVEAVDTDVDFDSTTQMSWIVDKVDRSTYEGILTQEGKAIAAMKAAEHRHKREELAKKLMADNPGLNELASFNAATPALPAE